MKKNKLKVCLFVCQPRLNGLNDTDEIWYTNSFGIGNLYRLY